MLLRFFKGNLPHIIIVIPIITIILWLPALFPNLIENRYISPGQQTPLFQWITKSFYNNYYINIFVAITLIISQSLFLLKLNMKFIFLEKRTYLPTFFFILISSSIIHMQNLKPALFSNIFILLAINKSFTITKQINKLKSYFEAGIFIGIATLIHIPSIYMLLFIWITLFVLRATFNWREWFASIIGIITPTFFYASILYLQGKFLITFTAYKYLFFNLSEKFPTLSLINNISLAIFLIILFISTLYIIQILGTKKINTRKYFTIFLWMLLLLLPVFFLKFIGSANFLYLIAIPVSFILSMFFTYIKNTIFSEILFTILIVSVLGFIWF